MSHHYEIHGAVHGPAAQAGRISGGVQTDGAQWETGLAAAGVR